MGLDMYLYKKNPIYSSIVAATMVDRYLPWSHGLPEEVQKAIETIQPLEEVAYWCKANQIHNFFMNCGGEWAEFPGDDPYDEDHNCGMKSISRSTLKVLIGLCEDILDGGFTLDGKPEVIKVEPKEWENFCNKKYEEDTEWDSKFKLVNEELARELLPTSKGFFFGSQEFDYWYADDLYSTINQLNEILAKWDSETEIYYHPWW